MYNGGYVYENKKYSLLMGCRGGGRMYHLMKTYGYEMLLAEGIRLKIKNPLWHDMDDILEKIRLFHSYHYQKSQLVFVTV